MYINVLINIYIYTSIVLLQQKYKNITIVIHEGLQFRYHILDIYASYNSVSVLLLCAFQYDDISLLLSDKILC